MARAGLRRRRRGPRVRHPGRDAALRVRRRAARRRVRPRVPGDGHPRRLRGDHGRHAGAGRGARAAPSEGGVSQKGGNKGVEAADAAVRLADTFRRLEKERAVRVRTRARELALQFLYQMDLQGREYRLQLDGVPPRGPRRQARRRGGRGLRAPARRRRHAPPGHDRRPAARGGPQLGARAHGRGRPKRAAHRLLRAALRGPGAR